MGSETAKIVGNRIREFRASLSISQEELAHRASMHAAHIGQIERGDKSPTIDSLVKIVDALEITLAELFDFKTKPKNIEDPIIEKITSYVKVMDSEEQLDVYKTIKMLARWKEKSKTN